MQTIVRGSDSLLGINLDYGFPLAEVRELADHWLHAYDWREHEAELNALPQFTTEIDGRRIHFLHVRSTRPDADALPLVLGHGRPGPCWSS